MKLGIPIAAGAVGVVIVSILALAVSFSKQREDPPPVEWVAPAHPPVVQAPTSAGVVSPAATSNPAEVEPQPLTPLQRAQREAAKRKRYLVALFYDPDAPGSRTAREEISKAVEKKYSDRMEIFLVPVTEPEHQATIRRLSIFRTPLALVFSPSGAVTHDFHEFTDIGAELAKAILSPKTEEIMAALQQRKVVFVYVSKPKGTMDRQNRAELEGLARLLSTSMHAVYVQNDAPAEQQLLREVMKIDPAKEAPVAVVVAQSGAIVEKIPGKLTRELLLKAFRKVLVFRSGCGGTGSGPGGGTCQ
jgi:hypothetical protein